jgi:hypothetical protein
LNGAVLAKGQAALNAFDMDCGSCGFDRARSHPAKIIKGAKKAEYYRRREAPRQALRRQPRLRLFLPAASS